MPGVWRECTACARGPRRGGGQKARLRKPGTRCVSAGAVQAAAEAMSARPLSHRSLQRRDRLQGQPVRQSGLLGRLGSAVLPVDRGRQSNPNVGPGAAAHGHADHAHLLVLLLARRLLAPLRPLAVAGRVPRACPLLPRRRRLAKQVRGHAQRLACAAVRHRGRGAARHGAGLACGALRWTRPGDADSVAGPRVCRGRRLVRQRAPVAA
mmetsp:Transcript_24299/g.91746  ORF Transcript_24299/g.91746 Transcript_24299/m.91746 type:complete len:209 (-) Transcript_24299:165-791(-)